jgi:DNA-binding transcriptional MerR regulator
VDGDSQLPFEEDKSATPPDPALPKGRKTFKPEELFEFTRVKPFVLKYWESEFPALKNRADGADYSRQEVELIRSIRRLLYDEGLTLEAARQRIEGEPEPAPAKPAKPSKPAKQVKPARPAKKKTAKPAVAPKKPAPRKAPAPAAGRPRSGAKRGLPGRSGMGLEDLLPDRAPDRPEPGKPKKTTADDGRAGEVEEKLAATLKELRGILTILRKGDR